MGEKAYRPTTFKIMLLFARLFLRLMSFGSVWMTLVSPLYRVITPAIAGVREESSRFVPGWEIFLPFNIFGTVKWNVWAVCGAVSCIPLLIMGLGILPRSLFKGGSLAAFLTVATAMSFAPWFIDTYEILGFGAALEATFDAKPQQYPAVPQNGVLWWNAAFILAATSYWERLQRNSE